MRKKKSSNARSKVITPKPPVEPKSPEAELVDKLLPENRIAQLVAQTTSFSGPLPHPEIFKLYAEVIPDAPERILKVFEDDSKHARDITTLALEVQRDDNRRAHWMAWSLVIAGFILSVVFALKDKDTLAGIALGSTLVAIVTGFLKSRNHDKPKKDES